MQIYEALGILKMPQNDTERMIQMQKGFSSFAKGIGAGMVAGVALAATGSMMMKNNKNVKKSVNKAVKTMGNLLDNVTYMMK